MYIPKDFRVANPAVATALIRRAPFGTLISVVNGAPLISHVPFSIRNTEPSLQLSTHLARANPHVSHLDGERVRIIFSGAHGYISPRWYSKPTRDVPTWNYSVVHCSGVVRIASDEEKITILAQLVTENESAADNPWSLDSIEREYRDAQLAHIVGFYVHVESIEAKFKLSQNRTTTDRDGAIAGLRIPGFFQNVELADAMEEASRK